MDVPSLVNAAMIALNALAPYAAAAGTAVATAIGSDAYAKGKEEAKRLFAAIKTRFAREDDGAITTQALQAYVDGSVKYESLVRGEIERLVTIDPAFAEALSRSIQSGPLQSLIIGYKAKAEDIEMTNTSGEGRQIIQGGDESEFKKIHFTIKNEDN